MVRTAETSGRIRHRRARADRAAFDRALEAKDAELRLKIRELSRVYLELLDAKDALEANAGGAADVPEAEAPPGPPADDARREEAAEAPPQVAKRLAALERERDQLVRTNLKTAAALDAANAASAAMVRVIEYVSMLKKRRSKAYSSSFAAYNVYGAPPQKLPNVQTSPNRPTESSLRMSRHGRFVRPVAPVGLKNDPMLSASAPCVVSPLAKRVKASPKAAARTVG